MKGLLRTLKQKRQEGTQEETKWEEMYKAEFLRIWIIMLIVGICVTIAALFFIDKVYISPDYFILAIIGRTLLVILLTFYGLTWLWNSDFILKNHKIMVLSASALYGLFIALLEKLSIAPAESNYHIGLIQLLFISLIFRIDYKAFRFIAICCLTYLLVNYNSSNIINAFYDLIFFCTIYVLVVRNYKASTEDIFKANQNLSEVTARIHHNWKLALTAIASFAKDIKARLTGKDQILLEAVQYQAEYMHFEAFEILNLIREPSYKSIRKGNCSLEKIYTNAISLVQFIKDNSKIISEPIPKVIIQTSDIFLNQILINLLVNAVTYSPDHTVSIKWEIKGKWAIASLSNTIHPSLDYSKLFQKFQSEGTGSGIGLYSTHAMVENMGGSLTAKISKNMISFILKLELLQNKEFPQA